MNLTEEKPGFNNTNYLYLAMQTPGWIVSEAVTIFLITTTIWLSVSIGMYVYKTEKLNFKKNDFTGRKVLLAAALVGPLTIPRLIVTQVVLVVGYGVSEHNDKICEILIDATIILFGIGLLPSYLYLWLRQRTFYLQPSLTKLYTKKVKVLSWGSLVFLILGGVSIVVLFIHPHAYKSSYDGCIFRPEVELPFYAPAAILLASQVILVGLFIYPLVIHRKVQVTRIEKIPQIKIDECSNNTRSPTDVDHRITQSQISTSPSYDVTSQGYSDTSPNRSSAMISGFRVKHHRKRPKSMCSVQSNRVLKAIQRSVVCSLVCVFSDFAAYITLTYILHSTTPKGITNVIYDFNLWVNILGVIFSFETYTKIFTAPCSKMK